MEQIYSGSGVKAGGQQKKKIGYVGTPQLLSNEQVRNNLKSLIANLHRDGYMVTVGLPNKQLADGTSAMVADLSLAEAKAFDAILVAPGGAGAEAEASKFASSAIMFYFINSEDAQYGKPDWLITMSGDHAKTDLIRMDAEDVAEKIRSCIMKKFHAETSISSAMVSAMHSGTQGAKVEKDEYGEDAKLLSCWHAKKKRKRSGSPE